MKQTKRLPLFMLTIAAFLLSLPTYAQQIVRGTLRSPSGEPIAGATVTVKETNKMTQTSEAGQFSIEAAPGNTLVFSSVGFATREVAVGEGDINEVLQLSDSSLNEVVVIGYQTVRKKDLTGAVSVVNPANANRVTSNSVAESIQGLAPGVTVRTGGAPGQNAVIEIRGAASFTNTSPLYVIDGMIADANSTINSNDVESIQILKDASAAAIYGSRAANGVVIITTKKGKEGPARIGVSARVGIQQIPKRWDVMNNVEYADLKKVQYQNSGLTPPASVGSNFDPSINTDWQDEMIRVGKVQDYNISLSGGTKTGTYLISGSYFDNSGVLEGHEFNRAGLRINTQSKKGRITFGENLLLTYTNDNHPAEGNPFFDMPQMLPVIAVRSDDYIDLINNNPEGWGFGTSDAITYAWNPVAVKELSYRRSNYSKIVGNAYVEFRLLNWLHYKFNAGLETSFDYSHSLRKQGKWVYQHPYEVSNVQEYRSRFLSTLFEHTLNFNRDVGEHHIDGVVGISTQHTTRNFSNAGRNQLQVFNGRYMTTIGSAIGDFVSDGGIPIDYRMYGYLGRINYSYADKYLLTLTGRIDEDSRFGKDYRSGAFPSVAAAWRISRENFFNIDWISDLKIHASYGELGINPLGSWDYIGFLNSNPRTIFGPDQVPNVGATQARLANPDLRWESRIVKNVGLDASLFNNRVSFTFEAYNSLSKDVLVYLPIAWYLGNLGGEPAVNAGSIRNKGIEASITYRNNARRIKWDASVNFTTIKNVVESVGNRGEGIDYIQVGATRSQVGHSLGQWYVLHSNGLFQSQEEIDNYKNKDGIVIQPFAKPGDIRYVDQNGDGEINDKDRAYKGSPWPKLQTGAQFNASMGPFTLNLQFVGVFGYTIHNSVRQILDGYQNTNFRKGINPWSPSNTNTTDPRIGVSNNDPGLQYNARYDTDRWLENGSYVRLRNIELGYNISDAMLQRIGFTNTRVYINAQNVFTITNYSGLDPDVVGVGIYERGVDSGNWPASRIISLGAQFQF